MIFEDDYEMTKGETSDGWPQEEAQNKVDNSEVNELQM
jgi:hypothetical protein